MRHVVESDLAVVRERCIVLQVFEPERLGDGRKLRDYALDGARRLDRNAASQFDLLGARGFALPSSSK